MAVKFTMTEQHLTLLRKMHVENGPDAPEIDQKRPYGNSDIERDVCELLHLPYDRESDNPMTKEVESTVKRLHRETATALQIVLRTGKFEPGTYRADWEGGKWVRVSESAAS